MARIEAGIPRCGVDMDEATLAPEAGLEARAISYTKGCYVGQEILNRLRTFAEVNKRLCRLKLSTNLPALPERGTKLFKDGKEVGYMTSATRMPDGGINALGYLRKEWVNAPTGLTLADGSPVDSSGPVP